MKEPSHNNCLVRSTWDAVLRIGSFWGQVAAVRNPQADLGCNREYKLIYYFFFPEVFGALLSPWAGTGSATLQGRGRPSFSPELLVPWGKVSFRATGTSAFLHRWLPPPFVVCSWLQPFSKMVVSWGISCEWAQLRGKTRCRAALEVSKGLLEPWATLLAQIIFSSGLG